MSTTSEVSVCPNAAALTRLAAAKTVAVMADAVAARGVCRLALSGGSTPRALYQELAAWNQETQRPLLETLGGGPRVTVPWSCVHVFLGDERFVPPDHEESNARMIRDTLLEGTGIPEENVHPVPTVDVEPDEAARQYEQTLARAFGIPAAGASGAAGEWPRFDLMLLGMGADGHTASLFPGEPTIDVADRWVLATHPASVGRWRISLTLPVINHARTILVLVTGGAKAPIIARVLGEQGGEPSLPIQRVQPVDGKMSWMLDEDAAGDRFQMSD